MCIGDYQIDLPSLRSWLSLKHSPPPPPHTHTQQKQNKKKKKKKKTQKSTKTDQTLIIRLVASLTFTQWLEVVCMCACAYFCVWRVIWGLAEGSYHIP